jgi:hypothetical protein
LATEATKSKLQSQEGTEIFREKYFLARGRDLIAPLA